LSAVSTKRRVADITRSPSALPVVGERRFLMFTDVHHLAYADFRAA
jgi:hypothetical protein